MWGECCFGFVGVEGLVQYGFVCEGDFCQFWDVYLLFVEVGVECEGEDGFGEYVGVWMG